MVAAGSSEGIVHVVRLDAVCLHACVRVSLCVSLCMSVCVSLGRKDTPVHTWSGAAADSDRAAVVELHCLDEQGPGNIVCYGTTMGEVRGMDLRVEKPVWTLQQEYKTGQSAHPHTPPLTHLHTVNAGCTRVQPITGMHCKCSLLLTSFPTCIK